MDSRRTSEELESPHSPRDHSVRRNSRRAMDAAAIHAGSIQDSRPPGTNASELRGVRAGVWAVEAAGDTASSVDSLRCGVAPTQIVGDHASFTLNRIVPGALVLLARRGDPRWGRRGQREPGLPWLTLLVNATVICFANLRLIAATAAPPPSREPGARCWQPAPAKNVAAMSEAEGNIRERAQRRQREVARLPRWRATSVTATTWLRRRP